MSYETQMVAALEQNLATALFHQSCLSEDCPASIVKEHKQHVARIERKLKKAKEQI